ncbi:hypothetical protein D3C86_1868620 [compost metagenome]
MMELMALKSLASSVLRFFLGSMTASVCMMNWVAIPCSANTRRIKCLGSLSGSIAAASKPVSMMAIFVVCCLVAGIT